MISTIVDKHGIKALTTFYYDGRKIECSYDIAMHIEALTKPDSIDFHEYTTIIIDLIKNEDDLFNNIDKQCRQNIRRAWREGIKYICLSSNEISDEKLDIFIDFYNKFAKQKNLNFCQGCLLKKFKENNTLFISYTENNDEMLTCHIFVVDDNCTRHLYSASLYREMDNEKRNLIGRANRMSTWEDIIYFKKRSYSIFDMGGICTENECANITRFKLEFGGEIKKFYTYLQIKTLKGNLYNKLINLSTINIADRKQKSNNI
ncbi:MAG: uncharacterized protein K0S55_801 [Clostridia bacterium]|nr:uncharacterized protein [Clostridia bacterium]